MRRAEQSQAHLINFEELSTRERMSQILERMVKQNLSLNLALYLIQKKAKSVLW